MTVSPRKLRMKHTCLGSKPHVPRKHIRTLALPSLRASLYTSMRASVLSRFSHVQFFATLWTVVHQAPLSLGFSRQEYWTGLPCLSPGDTPDLGIEPHLLCLLHCRRIPYPLSHLASLSTSICGSNILQVVSNLLLSNTCKLTLH